LLLLAALVLPVPGGQAATVLTTVYSFDPYVTGAAPWAGLVQGSDGSFYGTTRSGGVSTTTYDAGSGSQDGYGTVFKISADGELTTLRAFAGGSEGASPSAGLVQGSDGLFYGTTSSGGSGGYGTVFKISADGELTTLHAFAGGSEGASPSAGLVQGSDGLFYGTTSSGGTNNQGTVFAVSTGGTLSTLYSFSGRADGGTPCGELVEGSDGCFYGTTSSGGTNVWGGWGTVLKITRGGDLTTLHQFSGSNGDGETPMAGLVRGSDGCFYGTTSAGGTSGGTNCFGTVFKITSEGQLTYLHRFTGDDGAAPLARLAQGRDGCFYGTTSAGGLYVQDASGDWESWGTVFKISPGGVLTTLYRFNNGGDSANPQASLAQGSDGYLYGTTSGAGSAWGTGLAGTGAGTVFRVSTNGGLTTLYSFFCRNYGGYPYQLVQGSDGYLYGTANWGGTNGADAGTVFRLDDYGNLTSLHSFGVGADGSAPPDGLVQGKDGCFYGTTSAGGTNGCGTVFKITADGVLATLWSFAGGSGGGSPMAGLVQGSDGYLYGTTMYGANSSSVPGLDQPAGTVFKLSTNGALTVLHQFPCVDPSDGAYPCARLIQGRDGCFYGTTLWGGCYTDTGNIGYGTVFKITAGGTLSILHNFTGGNDGSSPKAALVQGTDGYLYGTTSDDLCGGPGTVFKIGTGGGFTTLYSFTGGDDGACPGRLVLASDGHLYGTTSQCGEYSAGTLFELGSGGGLTTLCSFTGLCAGEAPYGLMQSSDGDFYGLTAGGNGGAGTVFRLTIVRALEITTTSLPSATNGQPFSLSLCASGGVKPYSWSLSPGSSGLPPGLTLTTNGVISGAPAGSGSFSFSVRVTDSTGVTADQLLSLTVVRSPLQVSTVSLPAAAQGVAYTATLCASGGQPPYTWASTNLPAGLILADDGSLSGTPAVPGTAFFVVEVSDALGQTVSQSLALTVVAYGNLQITITPAMANLLGAGWQVDGAAPQASGAVVTGLSVGSHLVSFTSIADWQTPSNLVMVVSSGLTNEAVGHYVPEEAGNPQLTITAPKAGQTVSNGVLVATGVLTDKVPVSQLYCQLNTNGWTQVNLGDSWSHWTASVSLSKANAGTNTLSAYALDVSGACSLTNKVAFEYVPSASLVVLINGNGTVAPYTTGQLLALGGSYTLTASAAPNWVLSNWVGGASLPYGVLSTSNKLTFTMQSNLVLEATFAANPFIPEQGTFTGLFLNTNELSEASAGLITLTLTTNGAFTGKITTAAGAFSLPAAAFDVGGHAQFTVSNPQGALTFNLMVDTSDPASQQIAGTVSNGAWAADLRADRAVFNGTTSKATNYAGLYTLAISGWETPASGPGGFGWSTVSVNLAGQITLAGSLADGTALTLSPASVSKDGRWPFFWKYPAPPGGNGGALFGWLTLSDAPGTVLSGRLSWFRPAGKSPPVNAAGYTNLAVPVIGSAYRSNAAPLLALTNARVILEGGNLPLALTNQVALGSNQTIVVASPNPNRLVLAINKATGAVTGSFASPSNPKQTIKISGVLLQNQAGAAGYFLGTDQSGAFLLESP
jgi:uncharacterized repeat protein (TIGR03803 family)